MNVSREALIDEVQTLRARAEEAERERDKLEALAAGQAATIERIRQWAEDDLRWRSDILSILNPKGSE